MGYVEPDYLMREAGVPKRPDDPSFPRQWPLENTAASGDDERVLPAWGATTGNRSVVVAETDSGVDYNHPDLAANIWTNPGGVGGCPAGTHGYNAHAGNCDPMDDETRLHGHGTHVAGIIGAVGDNGTGVTGVNWHTTILPVKFTDSNGFGDTSTLISALQWILAAKQEGVNVRVVNDSQTYVGTAFSQALSDEIDRLGTSDILFVTAAGNSSQDNDNPIFRRFPCGYDRPNELCVAASDEHDNLASFSNYGDHTVDLAAPGSRVYSTLRGGTYGFLSGTSMSAAEVSGAAALILARRDLPTTALKADILDNVDPSPALAGRVRSGGRLDVCKAIPACFGTTTRGGHEQALSANHKWVNRYTLHTRAKVTGIWAFLDPASVRSSQKIRGVIYSNARRSPHRLIAKTRQLTLRRGAATRWYSVSFRKRVRLKRGRYWIGILSGPAHGVASIRWSPVLGSQVSDRDRYRGGPSKRFGRDRRGRREMSLYASFVPRR